MMQSPSPGVICSFNGKKKKQKMNEITKHHMRKRAIFKGSFIHGQGRALIPLPFLCGEPPIPFHFSLRQSLHRHYYRDLKHFDSDEKMAGQDPEGGVEHPH